MMRPNPVLCRARGYSARAEVASIGPTVSEQSAESSSAAPTPPESSSAAPTPDDDQSTAPAPAAPAPDHNQPTEPAPPAPEPESPKPAPPNDHPSGGPVRDAEQANELDEAASRSPIHEGDEAPTFILRTQAWFHHWLSNKSRVVLGLVVVFVAVVLLLTVSSFQFLSIVFDALNIFTFLGLFLVNWLGNGGALVPIPGARFIGLLMIFQQAVLMPSWEVFAVSGAAMALGLFSYYIAGVRTAKSYAQGDAAGAEQLAQQTGMLDDEVTDLSPGAGLDEEFVMAISGVEPSSPTASPGPANVAVPANAAVPADEDTRSSRLRGRFTRSLKKTQERAQPIIEQRGTRGMFLLCFAPTPMGTAAAYLGGLMRFGFSRYLLASFAAKYLLAGIIVVLALVFNDAAHAVQIPQIDLP
jgi:hypothetical protein